MVGDVISFGPKNDLLQRGALQLPFLAQFCFVIDYLDEHGMDALDERRVLALLGGAIGSELEKAAYIVIDTFVGEVISFVVAKLQ